MFSVKNQLDGHSNKIFSACFHPTNHFEFVTGGWDRTVHFWDMRMPASMRYISDVCICGDGLTINTAGTEVEISIYTCPYIHTFKLMNILFSLSVVNGEEMIQFACGIMRMPNFCRHYYLIHIKVRYNCLHLAPDITKRICLFTALLR